MTIKKTDKKPKKESKVVAPVLGQKELRKKVITDNIKLAEAAFGAESAGTKKRDEARAGIVKAARTALCYGKDVSDNQVRRWMRDAWRRAGQ